MAGGASTDDDGLISGINVTPFVDVALVLLIIFVVTARIIVSQPQIPVDLPRAASSQQSETSNTVQITIDQAGAISVEAQPMTEASLRALMEQRHAQNPEVRAIIAAHRMVPHGRVVQVIDIVRIAGVSRFGIQTELPEGLETTQ